MGIQASSIHLSGLARVNLELLGFNTGSPTMGLSASAPAASTVQTSTPAASDHQTAAPTSGCPMHEGKVKGNGPFI